MQEAGDFYDGQVLPTFLQNNNLTVQVDNRQSSENIAIVSYDSIAAIITRPIYACNVSSYKQWRAKHTSLYM